MHRRRALVVTPPVAAAAAALAVACGGGAPETIPAGTRAAAPASAEIAFSFGGRIHVMRADGSGRDRLTGGRAPRQAGGDLEPAWSPDATTLAFTRFFEPRSGDSRARIYLVGADGGRPRLLSAAGDVLMSPAWSPDGRRIAFVRWTQRRDEAETAIVVAEADGSGERVLRTELATGESWNRLWEPAWSPDGARIAFTRTVLDKRRYFRPSLYVMDIDGGEPRLLAGDAAGPAWSPDARRIAFSSVRDRNGKSCYEQCTYKGELYVMDADGTNHVRLTHNRGDDRAPSWSPDGRRIAFASDRNYPRGAGSEIYSVRPDGSCLTWLTNGAPASLDPAWRGLQATSSASGRCGATRRPPLVEVDTRRLRPSVRDPVYWLGKRYGNLLLSHAEAYRDRRSLRRYTLIYSDCAGIGRRACPPPLQLQGASVCTRHGSSTLPVLDQPSYHHKVRAFAARGLLFVDIGQGDLSVIAGSAHVRVFPGAGGRRGRRQLFAAIRDLRPFGRRARRLPPPALPRALLRRLRRTEQEHRLRGSVGAAARALGIPSQQVRRRLTLVRAVRALPRVRAVDCPR